MLGTSDTCSHIFKENRCHFVMTRSVFISGELVPDFALSVWEVQPPYQEIFLSPINSPHTAVG
jgi:hypothetical protein